MPMSFNRSYSLGSCSLIPYMFSHRLYEHWSIYDIDSFAISKMVGLAKGLRQYRNLYRR